MSRYKGRHNPDRVHLPVELLANRTQAVGNRRRVLVPLDSELAESILMLGDYFPAARREAMIGQVFSILMLSLLNDDADVHIDAMERVYTSNVKEHSEDSNKMWGEFLNIISVFIDTYEHDEELKISLEELLTGDIRVFAEEIFLVRWSRDANYLLVE